MNLTVEQIFVLKMMVRTGGGWYPLKSTWSLTARDGAGPNARINRVCKQLAELGLVEVSAGDPNGYFVCDWQLTPKGRAAVASR